MQEIVKKIEDDFHKEVVEVLNKYNKKLNDVTDCDVLTKVYKPKENEEYYYIDEEGVIDNTYWNSSHSDELSYKIGNTFKTKAHAELELEKLKIWTKLKRYAEEHNPVPLDWDDENQIRYCPYIDETKDIQLDSENIAIFSPLQIFTSYQVCEDAVRYIGGIEKLRLLLEQ